MDMEENRTPQDRESVLDEPVQVVSEPQAATGQSSQTVQTELTASEPGAGGEPKKKPTVLFVVAGLAALLLLLVVLMMSGIFEKAPKIVVADAWEATMRQSEQRQEKIKAEMPAASLSEEAGLRPEKTDFELTFQSLEGGDASLSIVSQMLSGFGLKGTVATDPENGAMELDGALSLSGADLLGLYFYMSPEIYAGGIPTFTDTMVSINPQSFAEDIKASILYDPHTMPDTQLQEIQDMLISNSEMLKSMNGLNFQTMEDDLRAIFAGGMENASYQKVGKNGSNTVYQIQIPGSDVKATMIELVRYIYLDSPLGPLYMQAFPAGLFEDGKTYTEMVEESLLPALEEELPVLDATLNCEINRTIRSVKGNFVPSDAGDSGFDGILMEIEFSENGDSKVSFDMGFTNQETQETANVAVSLTDTYADGAYQVDLVMDISGELEAGQMLAFQIDEQVLMDQNGRYMLSFGMDVGGMADQEPIPSFDLKLDGTVAKDGENTVWDFPTFVAAVDYLGEAYTLNLGYKSTTSPIEALQASRPLTPLWEMDESQMAELVADYQTGAEALVGNLLTGFFGMGTAMPESSAVPAA